MSKSGKWRKASEVSLPTEQRALMACTTTGALASNFLETKEYRRFAQMCEAGRRYGYSVVCVGDRGVGKTWAAHHYAQWDLFGPVLSAQSVSFSPELPIPRTAFYTPRSTVTPKIVEQDLALLRWSLQMVVDHARTMEQETLPMSVLIRPAVVDLLIVDEVDGLSHGCLEVLRDVIDQDHLSLVLLGRSACAKRLVNEYALASRIGVLHKFGALGKPETGTFFEQQLQRGELSAEDEAVKFFVEKTQGNFQEMCLLLKHIDYMVGRHGARGVVTKYVVEEALGRLLNKKNVQRLEENL